MKYRLVALAVFSALAAAQTPPAWQAPLAQQNWAEAETFLKDALTGGDTEPVLSGLALVYRATGRIQDADPILERLVALDESAPHVEDLARIKAALGNLERAEALYRRALVLRTGADLAGVVPVHQRLAQVLLAEMKFPEAEQEAQLAVAFRMRAGGPKDPELSSDYAALARIYEAQSKWEAAADVWETVTRLQADAFGLDSLRLADSLDSLAFCRAQLESFDQAEAALRRALAIRELNLGPSSVEVARTTDQLGLLFFHTKRPAEAEPFYNRSLDILLGALGPGNPLLARSYDNLAVTKAILEKLDEAEPLYREALKLRDAEDAISLRSLAFVLMGRGKSADAESLYSRALSILDQPGNANPELLNQVLTEYATVLHDLKRPADALKLETRLKGGKQAPQGKRTTVAAKGSRSP